MVSLDEYRLRRHRPATNEEYADLIRQSQIAYSDAVHATLDRMWDQLLIDEMTRPPAGLAMFRREHVHHWIEDNPGWDRLVNAVYGRIDDEAVWTDATPERTAEVNRVLRILHSTDQGSNDGDAEGVGGDAPPAR